VNQRDKGVVHRCIQVAILLRVIRPPTQFRLDQVCKTVPPLDDSI